MRVSRFILAMASAGMLGLISCYDAPGDLRFNKAELSADAQEGYAVFQRRGCDRCHTLGASRVTVVRQDREVVIPDLASPTLATDSLLVEYHLQHLEQSEMRAFDLTVKETQALGHFVAELHAASHPIENPEMADGRCPVCTARLNRDDAKSRALTVDVDGKTYAFECEDCRKLFVNSPGSYVDFSGTTFGEPPVINATARN